jgi:hypothetical protein
MPGRNTKSGLVPMSTELKFRRNVFSFPFVRVCNSIYAGFDNRFSVN